LLKQLPLLIFDHLDAAKEVIHGCAIILLMILIKPEFIDADQKTEQRGYPTTSWYLVDHPNTIIFQEKYNGILEDLGVFVYFCVCAAVRYA
jgi:hypothetical protein